VPWLLRNALCDAKTAGRGKTVEIADLGEYNGKVRIPDLSCGYREQKHKGKEQQNEKVFI
jgi:hypothetical protein